MYEYIQSIYEVLQCADKSAWTRGLVWYIQANDICRDIARTTGVPMFQVVGVMAALSPNNKWERNIVDTRNLIADRNAKVCTFSTNKRKALEILDDTESVQNVLDVLKGPKVQAFFTNILYPYRDRDVTLDRWAFRVAGISENDVTKAMRKDIEYSYKYVAASVGLKVHELQAITWEVLRSA